MQCPKCAAVVPIDPCYVSWCDSCNWNVEPSAEKRAENIFERFYSELGIKAGRQPFESMADRGAHGSERAEGGKIFNSGSIASGWALNADPKFQKLMKNVLFHFGVK